jgi:hypothetical protein
MMTKDKRTRFTSSIFLTALLLIATLLSTAESFSPSPNKTFRRSQLVPTPTTTMTDLQATVFPQDSKIGIPGKPNLPAWVNLPNRVSRSAVTDTLFTTEIQIGRLAMVGAVGLFLKEIVTGESVLEQISDIAHSLSF